MIYHLTNMQNSKSTPQSCKKNNKLNYNYMYYIHNLIFFQFVLVKFIIVRLWNMHDISHIKLFFINFSF